VHWLGLRPFGATLCKLLIIEPFSQWKLNNIETANCMEFGAFLVDLESRQQVRFNRVYFTIFRTKVWKILLFEWILLLRIQTNCKKLGLEGKISWALNVFTHGPIAQATLVSEGKVDWVFMAILIGFQRKVMHVSSIMNGELKHTCLVLETKHLPHNCGSKKTKSYVMNS